jgi:hypothetical protein
MGGVGATLACWAVAAIESHPATAIQPTKDFMAKTIALWGYAPPAAQRLAVGSVSNPAQAKLAIQGQVSVS